MSPGSRVRGVVLFAAAAAGLVGGHFLGYLLVAPDAVERGLLLTDTGHWYLSKAAVLAVVSAIVAGFGAAALGLARVRAGPGARLSPVTVGARLAGLQIVGFLALEVVERLLAGASLAGLLGPLLWLGLPLQVLVAVAGATLLALVAGTAAVVAKVLSRRVPARRDDARLPYAVAEHRLPRWRPVTPRLSRGPPLPSTV